MHYSLNIEAVEWSNLATAYGSAEPVRKLLISVLSKDQSTALDAASDLEGYLCHQHVQLHNGSAAALPFILEALQKTSAAVAEELIFVLYGYALATENSFWREKPEWMKAVTQLLCKDINIIRAFTNAESEDTVFYANEIIILLEKCCAKTT